MARLSQDISKAYTRSFRVEEANGISAGAILTEGTDKEQQVLLVTDDNDRFVGVAADGNVYDGVITVVEHGGYVQMVCDKAIANLNLPLYIDASAPQRVTDTLSATAGTYWRVGFSKSITANAGEYVMVFVDAEPVVVA